MEYCPKCGFKTSPSEVEGKIRDVCDSCGMILYQQWKVSAGVRVAIKNKILLVQRGHEPWKGKWHMPAGYVEVDETPIQAAEREALEETGYNVQVKKLVDCYQDIEDPRGNVIVLLYDAEILDGKPVTSAETASIGFFGEDDVAGLPLAGDCARKQIGDWITAIHNR